jgi:sigma-B regulation protein RsbU (phosphoserine phosphatase)
MKRTGKLSFGGIEKRVFLIFLITLAMVFVVFMIISVFTMSKITNYIEQSNTQQKEGISWISSSSIEQVLQNDLARTSEMEAFVTDSIFNRIIGLSSSMADVYEAVYLISSYGISYDTSNIDIEALRPNPEMEGSLTFQLLSNGDADLTDKQTKELVFAIFSGMTESFSYAMSNDAVIDSCLVSTPSGVTVILDRDPAGKYDEDGNLIPFDGTSRPWYKLAAETGRPCFTEIERDSFTGRLELVCACPAYDQDGNIIGVVGMDVFLSSLSRGMSIDSNDRRLMFIVNDEGHIVYSPEGYGILAERSADNVIDLRDSGYSEFSEFINVAMAGNSIVRTVSVGEDNFCMASSPITSMGWTLVSVMEKEVMDEPVDGLVRLTEQYSDLTVTMLKADMLKIQVFVVGIMILVFVIGSIATLFVAKRITRPIQLMTQRMAEIEGDNFDFTMAPEYYTHDEIQVMAKTFSDLSARTRKYLATISEITAEKERIRAELDVAAHIQADMLPKVFPPYPERKEFDLYASMTPAKEVGGDFFDFFFIDENRLALVIADVSGKGVPAALFMVIAKTLIKTRAQLGGSPADILFDVNNQLCNGNDSSFFVTVWLAIIDVATGKVVSTNAGHEHPAVRPAGGLYELDMYMHSPPLAMMENLRYSEHEFVMKPGDSLFVYTDGIPEATSLDNELMGTEKMLEALNSDPDAGPEKVLSDVEKGVKDFVGNAEQFDDMTMLCFRYNGNPEGGEKKSLELEARIENLDQVMSFVDGILEENDCPMKEMMQIDVAVEEIFVNIAHYAYSPEVGKAVVSASLDSEKAIISVSFEDKGVPFNPLAKDDPDVSLSAEDRQIGGLGIFMVKKSMDDVLYERKDGKNILTLVKRIKPQT